MESTNNEQIFKSIRDIKLEPGHMISGERKALRYIFQDKICSLYYFHFYNVILSKNTPFTLFL